MSVKLVDHSWTKIIERDAFAKIVLRDKIEKVQQLEEAIRSNDGADAAGNVLNHGLIVHALKRCLENLDGSTTLTEQDFWVCYEFATAAARKAEKILAEDDDSEE
ncbi:hypothetical protein DKY63_29925 [Pseudomonas putida]|uniref:Uncharacterized protein n=1 Tax=Pseudomonas putida TaxID=303 RepID=A0A2Z4RRW0_PSEPU|nr:hypothetical protein [Pseudomonas putida]AWY43903.1 hypothetical protein DKY63_29925 [Pseudomonas putida]